MNKLEQLLELTKSGINLEHFYAINFDSNSIKLQGYIDTDKIKELQNLDFIFEITDCGYCEGKHKIGENVPEEIISFLKRIKIVLT